LRVPTLETDLAELDEIADAIDRRREALNVLYARRQAIWRRRLAVGDVTQAGLARRSRIDGMTLSLDLKKDRA
jgi:hypothetical protein